MALALMVVNPASSASFGSGDEIPLVGGPTSLTSTEANTQLSCTEDATFSLLGARVISGNSGTASFRFRDAGADGSQLAQVAGTGVAEDAVNTDTLTGGAPGDLFNVGYTDTGTASVVSWVRCNVAFASGYGAFHGSGGGASIIHDSASSTRFFQLAGVMVADASATEANVAWKCRGYTTYEAMQVRVSANARTNDSTVMNRINGSDGTGTFTIGAGATGLFTDIGIADAIGDGQTISLSLTLGTGVEDLTIPTVAVTLKSTDTQQDIWWGAASSTGLARAASATEHYVSLGGYFESLTAYTEAQARVKPGFAGTASNWRVYLSANTYGANATMTVYLNGVSAGTLTLTAGGGAGWYEDTSNSFSFDDNDEISFGFKDGTSGSATLMMGGLTLAPTVAAAGQPTAKRFGGTKFASIRGKGVW